MRARRHCLVATVLFALVGPKAAVAQPNDKPNYEQAKQHYAAAETAAAAGDWATAIKEYSVAHEITNDAVLFFKIGNAYQQNKDCKMAITYYQRYISEGKPTDKFKAATEQRIARCKQQIADEGASEPGGGGADEPGASGPAADILSADEDVSGDDGSGFSADASADLPAEATSDAAPSFLDESPTWKKTAAWISVGVTIAFATGGAVLGLSASSREEDLDILLNYRDPITGTPSSYDGNVRQNYDDLVDEGQQLETLSVMAFAVAGVAAASAAVFFILDATDDAGQSGPAVTPTVGTDSVGAAAGWRF